MPCGMCHNCVPVCALDEFCLCCRDAGKPVCALCVSCLLLPMCMYTCLFSACVTPLCCCRGACVFVCTLWALFTAAEVPVFLSLVCVSPVYCCRGACVPVWALCESVYCCRGASVPVWALFESCRLLPRCMCACLCSVWVLSSAQRTFSHTRF